MAMTKAAVTSGSRSDSSLPSSAPAVVVSCAAAGTTRAPRHARDSGPRRRSAARAPETVEAADIMAGMDAC